MISQSFVMFSVSEDVLDCLVLRYDIDWPSNIIINDNTLFKYNEVTLNYQKFVFIFKMLNIFSQFSIPV